MDERITEKLKLSIVLLNYQGNPVVYRCLESIFNSSYSNYELVFVDNNSDDGSYEESVKLIGHKENVKIIRNSSNLGFTRGYDIGVKNSVGEYVLLLNNDTVIYPDALAELVKFMDENPNVGLAEGRIENIDDGIHTFSDPRIANFFGVLVEAGEHVTDPENFSNINRIFSPVGVWPIIRKEVYERVGGYDNDYLHTEEIRDLAARVWIFGYEVGYVFSAITIHVGRLTQVKENYGNKLAVELYYHATKNQLMFFFKNFSTSTIIKFYFPYISWKSADLAYTLIKLGRKAFYTKIEAYRWVMANLPQIMTKRKYINDHRIKSDKIVMQTLVKTDRNQLIKLISLRKKYDQKTEKWIKVHSGQ